VLDAGNEIALIRIRIPRGGPLRLEMPDGWNWFFLDKALTEAAPSWIQVTAGEEDAELWVDNRDPATRPAQPAEPPKPAEPEVPEEPEQPEQPDSIEEPAQEPEDDWDWSWNWNADPDGEGNSSGGLFRDGGGN